jgi:TetR/AcrR family transcriptional regulator, mexJK operon transcriptional repressor
MSAAAEVFIENGFSGASIDQIAIRAGVSKPTIYSHFTGKEQLFTEILNDACKDLTGPMIEEGADTQDLAVQLQRIAVAYAGSLTRREVTSLYRLVASESDRFPDAALRYFNAGPEQAYGVFTRFIAARIERGEIIGENPRKLAELFASMVVSPLRLRLLFQASSSFCDEEINEHCKSAVRLFLNGCASRPR